MANNGRTWESRAWHPGRSLCYIDLKGRLRAMVRECSRRETWDQVEMLQAFEKDLLSLQGMPKMDALQIIDAMVEQAATIVVAFEGMAETPAAFAAFMECEDLPQAMERVRGRYEGKHRNKNGARWRWRIACPADRLHDGELSERFVKLAPAPTA